MLIKLSRGLVCVLFVKRKNQTVRNPNLENKNNKRKNETLVQQSKAEDKCLRSNVRKPKSKVLHLALQVRLGKEGRHAKGLIR